MRGTRSTRRRARGLAALARNYSERVQELLGYDIFEPTFIGYVDGMHPKRLLGPEYVAKRMPRKLVLPG